MDRHENRAASYRRKARAFRTMAAGYPEGERREKLLDMALVWDRRAEAAEEPPWAMRDI